MKKHYSPNPQEPFIDKEGNFYHRRVPSDSTEAVRLDSLPPRLWTFFERFQTNCSLGCCGLSALAFKPPIEWDKRWNFNEEVFKWLEDQRERAEKMEAEVIYLPEFREPLYTADWLFLLDYLIENMETSKQWI